MEKVSVIMPVYLGEYEGCAEDREEKFVRAINSFLNNDYDNKELVIVGDACAKSLRILYEKFTDEMKSKKIKFYNMPKKQKLFSGKLRTTGLKICDGDYIMYLDSDDMLGDRAHNECLLSNDHIIYWIGVTTMTFYFLMVVS